MKIQNSYLIKKKYKFIHTLTHGDTKKYYNAPAPKTKPEKLQKKKNSKTNQMN